MGRGLSLIMLLLTPASLWAREHVVSQKNKEFSQAAIEIKPGDTVVFRNEDDTPHNVFTASEALKFNLGIQKAGTTVQREFAQEGEAEIRCAIHPKMKLKITVRK